MKILPHYPIWVLAHQRDYNNDHPSGFIRVAQSGELIPNQSFLECSKWSDLQNARAAQQGHPDVILYRVEEYEDGPSRLMLSLFNEKS